MNKDNLLQMANYLEGDPGQFDMRILCYCVLGHAVRHFAHVQKVGRLRISDYTVSESMQNIFGIEPQTEASAFLFAGEWGHKTGGQDPLAAAARLRYVAQHGDAPSRDQWQRFEQITKMPAWQQESPSLDDVEEFEEETVGCA